MLYNEPSPLETRVLTRRFGLADSASIDTYLATEGYQAFLKAAKMTPEQIIEEVKASESARTRRRRLSDRNEVELRAPHVAQAEVHRGQRRRERAGHLQGPRPDRKRSAPVDRRHSDRRARGGFPRGLRLHPRRIPVPDRGHGEGHRAKRTRKAGSARTSRARASISICTRTAERAHTSAAKNRRCSNRSKASAAFRASVLLFRRWSGAFQCPTVLNNVETFCAVPAIIRDGGAAFAALGVPKSGRHQDDLPHRPRQQAGSLRIAPRLSGAADDRRGRRRHAGRQEAEGLYSRRIVVPGPHRAGTGRRDHGLRLHVATQDHAGIGRRDHHG